MGHGRSARTTGFPWRSRKKIKIRGAGQPARTGQIRPHSVGLCATSGQKRPNPATAISAFREKTSKFERRDLALREKAAKTGQMRPRVWWRVGRAGAGRRDFSRREQFRTFPDSRIVRFHQMPTNADSSITGFLPARTFPDLSGHRYYETNSSTPAPVCEEGLASGSKPDDPIRTTLRIRFVHLVRRRRWVIKAKGWRGFSSLPWYDIAIRRRLPQR